jgi:holo-[acyl-carrier protein] synthase
MIIGVGIDMVDVNRVAEKVARSDGFKEKVFSVGEISYCEAGKNKAEHYAARFAAKEAFLKATGKGLALGYNLDDIEVVTDELGKPSIQLNGSFRDLAVANDWNKIHLSITHVSTMASAVVIIEQ